MLIKKAKYSTFCIATADDIYLSKEVRKSKSMTTPTLTKPDSGHLVLISNPRHNKIFLQKKKFCLDFFYLKK